MEEFLATVGSEFDASFVKLHVGTDDLDELLEFTWERSDLSPLVDAGLKPLLRNKLYRAILEERAARANRPATIDASISRTGTPNSEISVENTEASLSEIHNDTSSLSGTSLASTSQVESNLDVRIAADPNDDSSTTPRGSQDMVPDNGFEGHRGSESRAESGVVDVADFPPLGLAGNRPIVPQAKHTVIAAGTEEALAYSVDVRERRRAARKEAGDAQDKARQIQETAQQRARQAANLVRRAPVTQATPLQRAAQSASTQLVQQPRAQTQDSRLAARTVGYGRQFGADQSMSSAYQSSYVRGQPLIGCPRSCRICYPQG